MKPKQTNKKDNILIAIAMTAIALMLAAGCQKEGLKDENALSSSSGSNASAVFSSSPWTVSSSGVPDARWVINEMSAPDQTTCYGIMSNLRGTIVPRITFTHDGGDS